MKFISTRGNSKPASLRNAMTAGLAEDGGLYIPERFPVLSVEDFKNANSLPDVAETLLRPFFGEDEKLTAALPVICEKTFQFPIPLTSVPSQAGTYILELFHGPSSAFKDVGAKFLSECVSTLGIQGTVLVATSGDTGGAVAAAFYGVPGVQVSILFPKGKISKRQEAQLCAWGGNVQAYAVVGTFDDCQRIVKEALVDGTQKHRNWISANSINLARILPQMVYYAASSLEIFRKSGKAPSFIIPSGNLGNATAALWVKRMGLPIEKVYLALNHNRGIQDFIESGSFQAKTSILTLANAMDVGNPSNLERVKALYPDHAALKNEVEAKSYSDAEIESGIRKSKHSYAQVLCPHSVTAALYHEELAKRQPCPDVPQVLVATAHPAKFETIVEPLVGHSIEIPIKLQEILNRETHAFEIEPQYPAFLSAFDAR